MSGQPRPPPTVMALARDAILVYEPAGSIAVRNTTANAQFALVDRNGFRPD
jgi:hypothetical protein